MRRVLGFTLLLLGFLLIFLAPFIHWYAVPRIEKAPLDVDQTVYSGGSGTYFNAKALRLVGPVPIQNIQRYKGDVEQSTTDVVVINYQSQTVDLQSANPFDYDREVYAMDRKTGFAVNCCGEKPMHSGVGVKFPFDAQKTTYPLWDTASDRSYPAKFVGEDTIDGLTAYEWEAVSGPVRVGTLDLPKSLVGQPGSGTTPTDRMYSTVITVWAEPQTGAVVKGHQLVHQWAEVDGTKALVLANLDLEYTPQTVTKLVDDTRSSLKQLNLIRIVIPIVGPIIGLVLLGVGVWLLRGRRPARKQPAPQPAAATT